MGDCQMSGKHDLDLDLYIKKLERQIDVERMEHAEHLAEKDAEIRQLKRWKDGLKAIYKVIYLYQSWDYGWA